MTVLVVIVNYRTADMVLDCLGSLAPEVAAVPGTRAVVVDNGSGDGSAARLAEAVAAHGWSWAQVLPLEVNGGYAAGNNAALRRALEGPGRPGCVWLLNPDTRVLPGALRALLALLADHPEAGLVGSRLLAADASTALRSAFRFPSLLSELDDALRFGPVSRLLARWRVAPPPPAAALPVDWVAGASVLVRSAVFDAVGLLDEGYFLYYEEVDFCLAARRAGWRCWYAPDSRVVHLVAQASGVHTEGGRPHARRPAYWFESRRRYFVKNHGLLYAALTDLVWIASYLLWRVRWWLQRKRPFDPPHFLGDFVRHSVLVRGR